MEKNRNESEICEPSVREVLAKLEGFVNLTEANFTALRDRSDERFIAVNERIDAQDVTSAKLSEERLNDIHRSLDLRSKYYDGEIEKVRAYLTTALAASDKLTQTSFDAMDKAISKAESWAQLTDSKNNEFRHQLKDQATTFMPRQEAAAMDIATESKIEALHKSLESKIELNRKDVEKLKSDMQLEIRGLRESRSSLQGGVTDPVIREIRNLANTDVRREGMLAGANWVIGIIVALVAGIGGFLIEMIASHWPK